MTSAAASTSRRSTIARSYGELVIPPRCSGVVRALITILTVLVVVASPASAKIPATPPAQTAVVPIGRAPCGIAAQGESLWVGVYSTGRLVRLAAETGRVRSTRRIGPDACRLAVGSRAVWVTRDRAGELVRVPRAGGPIRRVSIGPGAFDVALGHGSVWATSFDGGAVVRVNPETASVSRVFDVGPRPSGVAVCGGSIWIGHGGNATWLTAIDPRSNRVRRVDVVVESPGWPRCVGGELWVTTSDAVLWIDAQTRTLRGHFPLGGTPAEAALGPDGLVWITDKQRSVVHRLDPAIGAIDSFPAGPGAYELVRVGRTMWVTSFAGADVRRFGS